MRRIDIDPEIIAEMSQRGMSGREIARHLGIDKGAVYRALQQPMECAAPDGHSLPSLFLRNDRPLVETEVGTVGIVGDQHEPFCLDGYLDHCVDTFAAWGVDRVVMIGDCIDHHAISYHEHTPDGMSPGDEYYVARRAMRDWYKAFPDAIWILGNHDRLPLRKVFTAGLPATMLRDNLYDCPPGWTQTEAAEIDGVMYVHGGGRFAGGENGAKNLSRRRGQNCVIGHNHKYGGAYYSPHRDRRQIFGLQVGCGVDHRSYSQAYCRDDGPNSIGCGIVVDGEVAHYSPMRG